MATDTFGRRLGRAVLRLMLLLLLVVMAAGIGLGIGTLQYNGRYSSERGGLIFQGVSVMGVDVGGLDRDQAVARVSAVLDQSAYPYVALRSAEQRWVLSTREMGGSWAVREAVERAWLLGRSGIFLQDMITRAHLLWQRHNINATFALEPGQSLELLRQVAKQAGHPARRATLRVAGLEARSGDAQVGREMDVDLTRVAIEQALAESIAQADMAEGWRQEAWLWTRLRHPVSGGPSLTQVAVEPVDVMVAFREVVPPLTVVAGAKEAVGVILSAPVMVTAQLSELDERGYLYQRERSWCIDQAVLATWLTVEDSPEAVAGGMAVAVDRDEIRAWVQQLADELARRPLEGSFDYDPNTQSLITLAPGQVGHAVEVERAVERIAEGCRAEDPSSRVVSLPVLAYSPRVTRADLDAMLPFELISTGESSFAGSTAGRLQNIIVASEQFDGATIAPQSTFSFLENLGLVTEATGFSLSWVILGDSTVLGPGGGVCQVSTTCYRAAIFGGYPIVERRPHAYRVSWYEPPLGLDAAVFSPSADMQFRNDTDTPILIKTQVDQVNSKLYFRFFGRDTGRSVTIEGPETTNVVPAPEPVYEVDEGLAPGQQVRMEWAHDGLDVTLVRVIEVPGQEPVREEIFSRYQPWAARFRVGPSGASGE